MTPKEKAEELVNKFININCLQDFDGMYNELAKQCALIAVEEILNLGYEPKNKGSFNIYSFYCKVKQEIEKL